MCHQPIKLPSGQLVGCRECWQCRETKIEDWVGRNIAESKTCAGSFSITLTYGRDDDDQIDHIRAALLTYSDVQKYFKLLRSSGYPLRYFAVGEYGSEKGRAHWHMMAYFENKIPDHVLNERFAEKHWKHGVSFWEKPTPASIRYICKYIQKDIGKEARQGVLAMSKKPPLGHDYFTNDLALRYAQNGLAPLTLRYKFDEARNRDGEKIKFVMRGKTADNFIEAFIGHWKSLHGSRHLPYSEVVEAYLDRQTEPDLTLRMQSKSGYYQRVPKPPKFFWPYSRDETKNTYVKKFNGIPHYWGFDDGKGQFSWQEKIGEKTPTLGEYRRQKTNHYRIAKE